VIHGSKFTLNLQNSFQNTNGFEPFTEPNVLIPMKCMISTAIVFALMTWPVAAQNNIAFYGNTKPVCLPESDSLNFVQFSSDSIIHYDAIFIFSSAYSHLTPNMSDSIFNFLQRGGKLYIGCENWPLQAEGNQFTTLLFNKQFWGAEGNSSQKKEDLALGNSVVTFPLDHRLEVITWKHDEPLVMRTSYFGGKLILDGGYSKFYCTNPNHLSNWEFLLNLLYN
jgi:hypothetical protein